MNAIRSPNLDTTPVQSLIRSRTHGFSVLLSRILFLFWSRNFHLATMKLLQVEIGNRQAKEKSFLI